MARRRNTSTLDDIASLPWQVGVVLGLIGFAAVRWGPSLYFRNASSAINTAMADQFAHGAFTPLAWLVLAACWLAAAASYLKSRQRRALFDVQTGLDSMRDLSWRQFEQLVGESLRRQGYAIEETGQGGADGGVDLIARRNGRTVLVQCKQWRRQQVGVPVVREMWGLVAHHRADGAMIFSVGDYTPDAAAFAVGKPIDLVTGAALLDAINSGRSAGPVRKINDVSSLPASPVARAPNCPVCASVMVMRSRRADGSRFWGCPSFPRCQGRRSA